MREEDIRIIIRCLGGECSDAEARELIKLRTKYPEEFKEIENIYLHTPFETIAFEPAEVSQLLGQGTSRAFKVNRGLKKRFHAGYLLKIAASLMVLVFFSLTTLYLLSSKTITNTSTQRLSIQIPDGSSVVLDRDASLNYRSFLFGTFNRQVKLNGRGFFTITPDKEHPFDIRTSHADIRVLGTRFSVNETKAKTQVILEEGKIRVTSTSNDETLQLEQAGEQVILDRHGINKHSVIKPSLYMAWLADKLEFNHCTTKEALEFLADTWDLEVVMNDSVAECTRLYGSAPSDDPLLIIRAIELITQQKISVK
ncbi:MAG: FecR domain-containing protein [Bacteroidota bacterium]|nr:FecR domain-containing protein [Bacteroidota bacterium]